MNVRLFSLKLTKKNCLPWQNTAIFLHFKKQFHLITTVSKCSIQVDILPGNQNVNAPGEPPMYVVQFTLLAGK